MKHIWLYILIMVLAVSPDAWAYKAAKHTHVALPEPQLIPVIPPLVATYDIYVGGLHLVTADVLFQERQGSYHALVKAHTYGFWARPFPWETTLDVVGLIKKDHFHPTEFFTIDNWNHHPKGTKLHFDGKGDVIPEFDPPNTDKNRDVVTEEQRHGSLDPITGLLQLIAQVAIADNCSDTVPIFDGKRRFDLTGSDHGAEEIDEDEYSMYKGKARLCEINFKMVAGEWKEKSHIQNGFWQRGDNEQGRDPFSIWLASLAPGLPELPVRLQSGSVWGLIVMHLTGWHYEK